jgi:hypothetical protein
MKTFFLIALSIAFSFNSFSQELKLKTTETDIERSGKKTITKNVISYHTIDLNRKIITYEGINPSGEKVKITYPIKSSYQDGVTSVIVTNSKGLKEFWFSTAMNNLGYDYLDGTRLACYNLTRIYYKE